MRKSDRHPIHFRIIYDDGVTYNSGHVDDLSETGMLIECSEPLPIGAIVRLEPVDADEEELFELQARVVRHVSSEELMQRVPDSEGAHGLIGLGLEFILPDPVAIHAMIDRLERKADTD